MEDRQWANEIADKYESGEWGWTKHRLWRREEGKNCFCLSGAIQMHFGAEVFECTCTPGCRVITFVTDELDWEASDDAIDDLARVTLDSERGYRVIDFNDGTRTTMQDVIAKLREYANATEGE